MNDIEKSNLKLNTALTAAGLLIMVCFSVIGYFCVDKLSVISFSIKDINDKVVPRVEHQVRWEEDRQYREAASRREVEMQASITRANVDISSANLAIAKVNLEIDVIKKDVEKLKHQ